MIFRYAGGVQYLTRKGSCSKQLQAPYTDFNQTKDIDSSGFVAVISSVDGMPNDLVFSSTTIYLKESRMRKDMNSTY